jgi:hypothetical protein
MSLGMPLSNYSILKYDKSNQITNKRTELGNFFIRIPSRSKWEEFAPKDHHLLLKGILIKVFPNSVLLLVI